jgi:hypothetical protein
MTLTRYLVVKVDIEVDGEPDKGQVQDIADIAATELIYDVCFQAEVDVDGISFPVKITESEIVGLLDQSPEA